MITTKSRRKMLRKVARRRCRATFTQISENLYGKSILTSSRYRDGVNYVSNPPAGVAYAPDLARATPGGSKSGGKSGGAGRAAHEASDTLRSKAIARGIDLLSEGQIVGLASGAISGVSGMKSVFFDGTPVENPDGSQNFKDFNLYGLWGTQDQSYIPAFNTVESASSVNVEIKTTGPVNWTQHFSDPNLDAVRVIMTIPQLSQQNQTNGDINGTTVNFKIQLQTNGGGYVDVINDTINGKTSGPYQRSYRVNLPASTNWDVRAIRITADSTTGSIINKTFVDSYATIIDAKLRYPNSALIGWEVDAEQFSRIPNRGYDCRGMIIKVPSNYDTLTRTYVGAWDGTFITAYSNNPAWVWYDFATSVRYGVGQRIPPSQLDKYSLYTIGQYCDGLVITGNNKRAAVTSGALSISAVNGTTSFARASGSFITDGFAVGDQVQAAGFANARNNVPMVIKTLSALLMVFGSDNDANYYPVNANVVTEIATVTIQTIAPVEPRMTCNLYLQTREEALKILSDLAGVFRGMVYYGAGLVVPVQDAPGSVVASYTKANVKGGKFEFQASAGRARHTVVIVSWNDLSDMGRLKYEYIEDQDAVLKYGINELNVAGFGCTSRGQAIRYGRWTLLTEQVQKETITFTVGLDGAIVAPGGVIQTTIPWRAGKTLGGRISKTTGTFSTGIIDLSVPLLTDLLSPITDNLGFPITLDN